MRSMNHSILPIWIMVLVALVAISGCGNQALSGDGLTASGTIEADTVYVAPEVGGKVAELAVDKGDTVAEGDVLAHLDTTLLDAQRDTAQSAVDQAAGALSQAQAELAKAQAGARPEERAAAQAAVDAATASRDAAVANVESAAANVAAAQGQLETAQAAVDAAQAQLDKAQAGPTTEELAIAEHTVEAAKNALWAVQAQRDAVCGRIDRGATEADCDAGDAATQKAEEEVRIAELQLQQLQNGTRSEDLAALEAALAQAQAGAETARANLTATESAHKLAIARQAEAEAGLEQAQAQLALIDAGTRSEDMDALEAQVAQAQAALDGASAGLRGLDTQIDRMTLTAPTDGVITERTSEVGELLSAGVPLYALADLDHLTLTVYVPEANLGRVALGQEASVTVDAYSQTFTGQVDYIASQAEFTPKNVELKEERVNMVFAVEIALANPDGLLLPGMPADVTFGPRPAATEAP